MPLLPFSRAFPAFKSRGADDETAYLRGKQCHSIYYVFSASLSEKCRVTVFGRDQSEMF
jgi:hypothetical protein